jgi:subtilisin family serine protease
VSGVIAVGSENDPDDVTVRAPGDSILVPIPGGGFDFASGSSLSAAQVSGIVALLVARQPGLSRTDVTRLLVDSRPADRDDVNACRALAELLQLGGCDEKQSALHQP